MAVLRSFLSSHFLADCVNIFQKRGSADRFDLNSFKSYDTNEKHAKNTKIAKNTSQIRYFLQNCKKPETEIFAFSVITFEPIDLLSISK